MPRWPPGEPMFVRQPPGGALPTVGPLGDQWQALKTRATMKMRATTSTSTDSTLLDIARQRNLANAIKVAKLLQNEALDAYDRSVAQHGPRWRTLLKNEPAELLARLTAEDHPTNTEHPRSPSARRTRVYNYREYPIDVSLVRGGHSMREERRPSTARAGLTSQSRQFDTSMPRNDAKMSAKHEHVERRRPRTARPSTAAGPSVAALMRARAPHCG